MIKITPSLVTGERQTNTDDARRMQVERQGDDCATMKRLTSLPAAECSAAAFPDLVGFCTMVIGDPPMSRRRTRRQSGSWLYRACRRPRPCSSTRILCVHHTVICVAHRSVHTTPADITRQRTVYCFRSIVGTAPTPVIRPRAAAQSRSVPAATDRLPRPTSATATALGPTWPMWIDRRRCRRRR